MSLRRRWSRCLFALLGAAAMPAQGAADPPASLLAQLPDGVLIAAEIGPAGDLLRRAERALGPLPDDLPQSLRTQIGVGMVALRAFCGGAASDLLDSLAGGGAVLGLVPAGKQPLPLLVLRPGDPDAARTFLRRFPDVHWQERGDLLLASSTEKGLELLAAGGDGRWAHWPDAKPPAAGELRAYLDLAGLREVAPGLRADAVEHLDGGGKFFAAAFVHAAATGQRLTLSLRTTDQGFLLDAVADAGVHDERWFELWPQRAHSRTLPAPPAGALLTLTLDRSVTTALCDPARFFDEAGVVAVRTFLSVADQVDGSTTSFARDIVGALREPWTLYALPIAPPADGPAPPLQLPGIALCAPLAKPAAARDLVRTASALLLIVNVERGRLHKTPFVLRAVHDDDVDGLCAMPAEWRGPGLPPTEQGLSPTLLFGHGHAVLATTQLAARAVLARIADGSTVTVSGDALLLDGNAVASAWLTDAKALALARQLDEGETADEAAAVVTAIGAVLRMLPAVRFELTPGEAATSLRLSLLRP